MNNKHITVGIPAYKAQSHIADCLSSIQIQTIRDEIEVIIASDFPGDDYGDIVKRFPDLSIKILPCEKNGGPGQARQRALNAATTEWITFIDADDVFINPFAIETLSRNITNNCIEVQGPCYQEIEAGMAPYRIVPRNDVGHPWVFGRLYNVRFLRQNKIGFSELSAMEDGEFNWKISMTIEGTPLQINIIDDPIYLWRTGSEHSITRIGIDDNGIPQYNFDLCQWGATEAAINAIKFCKKSNPFNGSIIRFTTEIMVGQYFTYVECLERKPIFAEQNFFNAKRFYHECYKDIENQIDTDVLKTMYTQHYAASGESLIGIIPEITFFDFLNKIKTDEYGGEEEFKAIRAKLPKDIIENDIKSGVATF